MPRQLKMSMHEDVKRAIRSMIVTHQLKPGEWISEDKLSETLGVSRTPLREALKALATEKLVELHAYRGAMVTGLSPELVGHLFEAQALLESQAIRLACERAIDLELEEFGKIHAKMIVNFERGNRALYSDLNKKLHRVIVAMSHNPTLVELHDTIIVQVERARNAALEIGGRWAESAKEHEAIYQALSRRDADLAAALMHEHVLQTGRTVKMSITVSAQTGQNPQKPRRRNANKV